MATWSIEKGRRVGAVIVGPDNEIRSTGYNSFPRGIRDDVPERLVRLETLFGTMDGKLDTILNHVKRQ